MKPTAAVDGNVLRVITRLTENDTDISSVKYRADLENALSAVYPKTKEDCSAFTQSLFEIGALICKPQNPDCKACPLREFCQANQHATQLLYPVKPMKKEKREENVFIFLLQTPNGFCIQRREQGVLKGMNAFPSFVSYGETAEQILNEWGMYAFTIKKQQPFTHIFTHIKWNITCIYAETDDAPFDTYTLEEIEESISLPTAFKQCLGILKA